MGREALTPDLNKHTLRNRLARCHVQDLKVQVQRDAALVLPQGPADKFPFEVEWSLGGLGGEDTAVELVRLEQLLRRRIEAEAVVAGSVRGVQQLGEIATYGNILANGDSKSTRGWGGDGGLLLE